MPPTTTPLKPTQMASTASRTHNHIRIRLDLRIRHRHICDNRIVFGMQAESRSLDRHHGISRASIAIVCPLGRIAPGRTLYLSIEIVQVLDLSDVLRLERFVDADLLFVCFEQLQHA